MKKILLILSLLTSSTLIFAQSALKANTDWLTTHLNKLVVDNDDKQLNLNGKKSKACIFVCRKQNVDESKCKRQRFFDGF